LGESLLKVPGVSVLQTGTSIYKPVINGLHSSRILIINNGIRHEGQQWGSEHAPEIDPYVANRLTVIKGAGTIRYEGDAIGGVILVEPKALTTIPAISAEVNLAGFSNNRMGVMSAIVEGSLKKLPSFGWRMQGTMRRGGNARTPNYWLENSGLSEYNYSVAAGWQKPAFGSHIFFSSFDTELGIFSGSHIGNTTDLTNAINSGQPPDYIQDASFTYKIERPRQNIRHYLFKSKSHLKTGNAGRISLVLGIQYNKRQEYDLKKFSNSADVPQLDLRIASYSSELVWDHNPWKGWRGTVGFSTMLQENWYQYRFFLPNYQLFNGSTFLIEKRNIGKLAIETALRYDLRTMFYVFSNENKRFPGNNFGGLSGNLGLIYNIDSQTRLTAYLSTGWRGPNANELYSDGLHHSAARIEKGNLSLQPERANSLITSIQYQGKNWRVESECYYKLINNFIYLLPVYPPQLTIRGAFPSFAFSSADASLYGGDIDLYVTPLHHIQIGLRTSMLWAWNRDAKEWLIQMPPNSHQLSFEYNLKDGKSWKNIYLKLTNTFTEQQKRVPATGNIEVKKPDGTIALESDYAPPPSSYFLTNLEASTSLQTRYKPVSFTVSFNNLFNTSYRNYMNAFRYFADEAGFNLVLRIHAPLSIVHPNKL
jgi:iron complex outermembrane receptor protein